MKKPWKNVVWPGLISMALGVSASAHAASGVGPYYAMPSWDQTLPAETRFIVLTNMNSEAVLDRETGIIWERTPSGAIVSEFSVAIETCRNKLLGGRKGWRLPTLQELQTLTTGTNLPAGHPFNNVQTGDIYWSATAVAGDASSQRTVFVGFGLATLDPKNGANYFWCVRSTGYGSDVQ